MSRRQRYSRPTPLTVSEKEEEEEPYTLPATVYSPEFDEVEEQQHIRLGSPTDISGLFDDDSDTSDSSSAASSRAESLVDNERVVFVGRQKRESLRRLSTERDRRSARNSRDSRDSRDSMKTSTPVTPMVGSGS